MQFLKESACNVVPLSEIVNDLRQDRPLAPRTVALVFDDGYENIYATAFPILQEYSFTATVFLITGYCGRHNDWPGNSPGIERQPLLSWPEIKEMRRFGLDFGAHTVTHPDLTNLPRQQAEREIAESKAEIEAQLGNEIELFAYPYGKHDAKVKELVQMHFHGACGTELGEVGDWSDPLLLTRIDTYYLSHQLMFSRLHTRFLARYLSLRQGLRKLKHST
jgi:peptidoglycan/xylan/chitin deacetylase (PgdA/CDA1 family)